MKLIQYVGVFLLSASALSARDVEVYYTGPGISAGDVTSQNLEGFFVNDKPNKGHYIVDLKNAIDHPQATNGNIRYELGAKTIGPIRFGAGKAYGNNEPVVCPLNGVTNTTGIIPVTRGEKVLKKITVNLAVKKSEYRNDMYTPSCAVDAIYE